MPIKGMFHSNPKPKHMAVRNRAPIAATEINKANSHSKSLQCTAISCTALDRAWMANMIAATDKSNTCHNIVHIYHSTYSKKDNAATTGAMPMLILRKAVEVAIVAVRAAVINDRTKFAAIEHPRPGTKYRQTRTGNNK